MVDIKVLAGCLPAAPTGGLPLSRNFPGFSGLYRDVH